MRLFNFFKPKCITEAATNVIEPENNSPKSKYSNLKLPDRIPTCQSLEDTGSKAETGGSKDMELTDKVCLSEPFQVFFIPKELDEISELTDTEVYQDIGEDEKILLTRQESIVHDKIIKFKNNSFDEPAEDADTFSLNPTKF